MFTETEPGFLDVCLNVWWTVSAASLYHVAKHENSVSVSARFNPMLVLSSPNANLHQFPAVCREQQMHRVVLQLTLLLQVGADQLPDGCGPVCNNKPNHGS